VAATLWGPSGGGSVYANAGDSLPFLAEQSELEDCCCGNCVPCCEDPWIFCVTVDDGSLYAYAAVTIDTVLTDCCCATASPGYVDATLKRCDTDAVIGTLRMSLLVTYDGCFAQFTVISASFATCSPFPPGCPSAWVKGTLTGTVPSACELAFATTIARNGTTPLNIAAGDWPCTFEYEKCVVALEPVSFLYEKCVRP